MSQTAPRSKTVFRACVVNAVRGGEVLMEELIKVTRRALTEEEASNRNIQQRNLLSDSLRLLGQHEAALVKGYPMALLEIFAEGPAAAKGQVADETGMDFGELSLMDESEMQAQVELSKAQQSALHATDAVLAELNTLVSAAQGLRNVQPERNPLRPESYIRALQQVVTESGVAADVRQLWMQHMRDLLGRLLVDEYKKAVASLREHGVQPVGYAVLGSPGSSQGGLRSAGGSLQGSGYGAPPATGYGGYSGYGPSVNAPMGDYGTTGYGNTGYGRGGVPQAGGWAGDGAASHLAPAAEEALLTVGILRQMLAGGGDPFDARGLGTRAYAPQALPPIMPVAMGHVPAALGGPQAQGAGYAPDVGSVEAMQDMAQLERLVGRLAGAAVGGNRQHPVSQSMPVTGWNGSGVAPVLYAAVPMEGATQSAAMAMEVVGRMMFNIAQDTRLLPPVQKAVQSLEPALKQLVAHDGRFFTDGGHPARRLLDELTQRSLAFPAEAAPGFSGFMRLVTGAVEHLSANEIRDAGPFDTVLKALQTAWEAQEKKIQAYQEAQQKALLQAEQREMLAEKIAADIRALARDGAPPADIVDFAAGPWADVIALAQVSKPAESEDDDPGGYLALVPVLLWSSQPDLARLDPERLNDCIPSLLAKLRKGLKTVGYPAAQSSALLQRLVSLQQKALEKPREPAPVNAGTASTEAVADGVLRDPADNDSVMADVELTQAPDVPDSVDLTDSDALLAQAPPDPYADFVVGAWVELTTNGRVVRTQLTWASPHGTLFLFTAPDASTQSMTRRMRDKLATDGSLRVVPAPKSASARALEAAGGRSSRRSGDSRSMGFSASERGAASAAVPLSGSKPAKPR